MKLLILVLLHTVTASLRGTNVTHNVDGRIIGGDVARAGQFPFSAAIYAESVDSTHFCGGALINNQFVLTAAECVFGITRLTIHFGANSLVDPDSNRLTVTTASVRIHPEYEFGSQENNIALVRLRLPIEFSEFINAIALPATPLDLTAQVTSIGWGLTSDDGGISETLNFVQLVTLTNDECRAIYGNIIVPHMVCAVGNAEEGICIGDSGGPLVEYRSAREAVHVGIATFVSGNGCGTYDPSGFVRTYPFVDWIKEVAENP